MCQIKKNRIFAARNFKNFCINMKTIAIIARILLGIMFIFSGFVKGIDPWGSTYKFIDYFTAFNMTWMHPTAFSLAIVQNAAEFVIGVALVVGLRMKETAWGALLFMGFFTPLTLVIALTNPVSDCGCFGDALILSNWETFFKNVVMMIPTVIIFLYRKKYTPAYKPIAEWTWVAACTVIMLAISIHCYRHLPWIDFRPYRIGADIRQGRIVPEDAPGDVWVSRFIYEKNDGTIQEFSEEDFPWDDPDWEWRETINVLVSEGYVPPIREFNIRTLGEWDITDEILEDQGYTFLLVAYDLNKSNKKAMQKAQDIANYSNRHGHSFYALTASTSDVLDKTKSELKLDYEFCITGDVTLKTIVRANPGLVLLQNGTVIGKWHHNDMPEVDDLKPNLLSFALDQQAQKSKKRLNRGLLLVFALFAATFYHFRVTE